MYVLLVSSFVSILTELPRKPVSKYDDKIEMLMMFDEQKKNKAFSSIEAHTSFKLLEDE